MVGRCLTFGSLVLALLCLSSELLLSQQESLPEVEAVKKLGAELVGDGVKSSWAPDGRRLVYGNYPFGAGLRIRDLKTGKTTDLLPQGKDPAWAPGEARLIAYVRGNGRDEEVWVVDETGKNARKLAEGGYPTWSSDGKTLYFHSRKRQAVMSVVPSQPQEPPKSLYPWPSSWYPAVSPDGKKIAAQSGPRSFVVIDLESNEAQTWPYAGNRTLRGFLPAWSPNGRLVAFGSYGGGEKAGLWVLDLEAGGLTQVFAGDFTMPAFSRDGSKMSFDLRGDPRQQQVWMIETKAVESLQQDRP